MKYICLIFLACISLISCKEKADYQDETPIDSLGKYIYRDDIGVHHIDPSCNKLTHGKDDRGHDIYAKHMMDTSGFVIEDIQYFRVCSHCVNDKEYEHILRISKRNY